MTKPFLIYMPQLQFYNAGLPLSGGFVSIYQPGTTTLLNTYPDSNNAAAGTNPNPNPITLDVNGRPQSSGNPIDLYVTQAFKMVVQDSNNTTIWTKDNITNFTQVVQTSLKTTNYTTSVSDRDKLILIDASLGNVTVIVLLGSTAGDGFNLKFKKIDNSTNTVTIQTSGSDTIDGSSNVIFYKSGDYLEIYNYNSTSTWYSVKSNGLTFKDASGNTILMFQSTANAVDYLQISNSSTGNPIILSAQGSDTNINLNIEPKGTTGNVGILSQDSSTPGQIVLYEAPTNGSNYIGFKAPAIVNSNVVFTTPNADGTAAKPILVTNGSATLSWKGISVNVQVFTSSGTYTPTSGMQSCKIECIGGGGGGAGVANSSTTGCGSGGGSGGYSMITASATTIGVSQVVTIGSGGAGGVSAVSQPGAGGTTSVGSICIANPGSGATNASANTSSAAGAGANTSGAVGTLTLGGTTGSVGVSGIDANSHYASGGGGSSTLGGGGPGISAIFNSAPGTSAMTNTGSGGGGGISTGSGGAQNGGAGAAGVVIITEFILS